MPPDYLQELRWIQLLLIHYAETYLDFLPQNRSSKNVPSLIVVTVFWIRFQFTCDMKNDTNRLRKC